MRLSVTYGLAGAIASLLALGALFLGGLSMRVVYSGEGEFVDAARGVWIAFGLWNLLVGLVAVWAAYQSWRGLFHRIRRSRDRTSVS